jgi:hypothetical protein
VHAWTSDYLFYLEMKKNLIGRKTNYFFKGVQVLYEYQ